MKLLIRPVRMIGLIIVLAAVISLAGCHLYHEVVRVNKEVSVSNFYKSKAGSDLERLNRDMDPTNVYN